MMYETLQYCLACIVVNHYQVRVSYFIKSHKHYIRACKSRFKLQHTCTIETKEIADPVSDGGFDSLDFGLEEYAEGEAERTFSTY